MITSTKIWLRLPVILALTGLLALVISGCAGQSGPGMVLPAEEKAQGRAFSKEMILDAPRAEYFVDVGGKVDMDNSLTHLHHTKEIFYQNNISLTISNQGRSIVHNPRILINGQGIWQNTDHILKEALKEAQTDQDKIHLILRHMAQNTHHDLPCVNMDNHNPVAMYNVYGGGFCDDLGLVAAFLLHRAGFNKKNLGRNPLLRRLNGHVMCEIPDRDGGYQFIDTDQISFYLDRENKKPVAGDSLVKDHDLVKRELGRGMYPPSVSGWDKGPQKDLYPQKEAALFGSDDTLVPFGGSRPRSGRNSRMDYFLRPGERIVFRWDNVDKLPLEPSLDFKKWRPMGFFGNSRIIYQPDLSEDYTLELSRKPMGVKAGPKGLEIVADKARIGFWTKSPFVIVGGSLGANIKIPGGKAQVKVAVSRNGLTWQQVQTFNGPDIKIKDLSLDNGLRIRSAGPTRKYAVLISITNGRGGLISDLKIETDILASPMALPRLRAGKNRVVYQDDTKGPRAVKVTHHWQEFPGVEPPPAPGALLKPNDVSLVKETFVDFLWAPVQGAELYHFTASRRPDMLYPFRPCLDVYLGSNSYRVEKRGIFTLGENYFWRVRARKGGVWGDWSRIRSFAWEGPMVPRDVRLKETDQGLVLCWEPNPAGTRPVRYHVFGSDERGFSVSREPHFVLGLGRVPGNYVGTTGAREMLVVSRRETRPNMNRAFYRVVAEDGSGVESCPSSQASPALPYLVTQTLGRAVAGQNYRFGLKTVTSVGDLQFRNMEFRFFEQDAVKYRLVKAPPWLSLDESGFLTGHPLGRDKGRHELTIELSLASPADKTKDKSGTGPVRHNLILEVVD